MNEEQPNFKVTDRRLFNADGSPRDLSPDEQPEPKITAEQPVLVESVPMEAPRDADKITPEQLESEEPVEEFGDEDIVGAKDPTSFVNFVMSIASNAASSLGMMEHPVTHQRDVDIEVGKHWIDILGMLEKKTKGNLVAQERQMLEGLLADLRMQYVSLASSPPKSKGFSGSDITGGR